MCTHYTAYSVAFSEVRQDGVGWSPFQLSLRDFARFIQTEEATDIVEHTEELHTDEFSVEQKLFEMELSISGNWIQVAQGKNTAWVSPAISKVTIVRDD